MNIFRKSKGFSLVEVIIVIAIMAVLSALIYASFNTSRAQSRDQKRISDISTIQLALEQYFNGHGVYPTQLNQLVPTYLPSITTDTTNKYANQYFPLTKTSGSSNCVSYQLWATFETSNSYLDSKKGFDSSTDQSHSNLLSVNTSINGGLYYECGTGHTGENAFSDPLVYDVMP